MIVPSFSISTVAVLPEFSDRGDGDTVPGAVKVLDRALVRQAELDGAIVDANSELAVRLNERAILVGYAEGFELFLAEDGCGDRETVGRGVVAVRVGISGYRVGVVGDIDDGRRNLIDIAVSQVTSDDDGTLVRDVERLDVAVTGNAVGAAAAGA